MNYFNCLFKIADKGMDILLRGELSEEKNIHH